MGQQTGTDLSFFHLFAHVGPFLSSIDGAIIAWILTFVDRQAQIFAKFLVLPAWLHLLSLTKKTCVLCKTHDRYSELTRHRFGPITGKYVLYRGEDLVMENGITYRNVEAYLMDLQHK